MKFPDLERINQNNLELAYLINKFFINYFQKIKDLVDYGKILILDLRLLNSNIDLNILKLFCLENFFKYFIINEI